MKKLLILVTALAMVACFMPKAEADLLPRPVPTDSASLNLKVTFDLGQEPTGGKYDERIKELSIKLDEITNYAEKIYNLAVDNSKMSALGIGIAKAVSMLESLAVEVQSIQVELKEIAARIKISQQIGSIDDSGEAVSEGDYTALVKVSVKAEKLLITINGYIEELKGRAVDEPVIAIELADADLNLEGMKLGEVRSSSITVKNTGNVLVMVDIGYISQSAGAPSIRPDITQGVDKYVTMLDGGVIPPDGRILFGLLAPKGDGYANLFFGAPTELSRPVTELHISYELRAYPGKEIKLNTPIDVKVEEEVKE